MDRSSVAQILGAPHTRFAIDPYEYFMYELTKKTTLRKGATYAMYGFLTVGLSCLNRPDEDAYFVRFEDNRVEAFGRMGDFTPADLVSDESRKHEVSTSTAARAMFLGK